MSAKRTLGIVLLVAGLALMAIGSGAFTTVESQRAIEVYSDDNPGGFVTFEVDDRDSTACSVRFEVTNGFPMSEQAFEIDDVEVTGQGFGAWASSVPSQPVDVGESAVFVAHIDEGHVGHGTLELEMEMSGDGFEIELEEETWVYCEEPDDDEEDDEDDGGDRGGGAPNPSPPGRR